MNTMIVKLTKRSAIAIALLPLVGCIKHQPRKTPASTLSTAASTMPAMAPAASSTPSMEPTTMPMAPATMPVTPTTMPMSSTTMPATQAAVPVATQPVSTQMPAPSPAQDAAAVPTLPLAPVATQDLGTVAKIPGLAKRPKPFIAWSKGAQTTGGRPSTLLLEHASPDSPVPLSEFGNQPTHSTEDFQLRASLSAADVQKRLGPPAQIAVNDDPWLVYRLAGERELWLHFAGPDHDHLLTADVIRGVEDGYARETVFQAP